jgi:hypothetical protein
MNKVAGSHQIGQYLFTETNIDLGRRLPMLEYRRTDIDLSTRIDLGLEMLRPVQERGWGRATELAEQYNLSRTWLYKLGARAKAALEAGLQPGQAGRPLERKELVVDRDYLRRAIALMPLLTGSVRSIQTGLELLFDMRCSVGYISQTLREAGQAAKEQNGNWRLRLPVLGEADEIFVGRKPCLTVVDGRSFLVLNLQAAAGRDATHWGLTFLDLSERGIVFQDLAADGARGIRSGLRDAELSIPLRPDLFHLLREGKSVQNRLEKAAYKAMRLSERAQRAEREAQQPKSRRGRPLKCELSATEAAQKEDQALETHDDFCWLLSEIRQALEPIRADYSIQDPQQARGVLETALALLADLPGKKLALFVDKLHNHMDELLAPLVWLHERLAPWLRHLPPEMASWIVASRQHDHCQLADLPPQWHKTATAIWDALALFHRSSSLAEALHSWLRPYLSIHRGIPDWLLPLLQLFWNHHLFARGKRAGQSPLQLAGIVDAPSLARVFDHLLTVPVPP